MRAIKAGKGRRIVIDNATILHGRELEIVKGHVLIRDGIIEKVSEGSYNYADKIDARRGIILPAFTNAHLHIADSVAKDAFAYKTLEERVGRHGVKFKVIRREKKLGHAIVDSLRFMQKAGISSFCDFREGGVAGIEALKKAISDFDHEKFFKAVILGRALEDCDISLAKLLGFLEHCNGFGVASLSRYDFHFLKKARKAALERKKLFAVHFAEKEESRESVEKLFSLKPDFVVHLTNAEKETIGKIKRKKINIVLCPRANASFAAGLPDLKEIFSDFDLSKTGKSRVKIGIGTDNVMANSLNMLREAEFIFKLYRGLYKDHSFRAENVLACATFLGRELLRLPSNAVEEGNEADFICFRKGKYLYDPALYILHRAEIDDIRFALYNTITHS